MEDFELTFAPVPPEPSDEWLEILIALFGLGITAIAAPFFDESKSRYKPSLLPPVNLLLQKIIPL